MHVERAQQARTLANVDFEAFVRLDIHCQRMTRQLAMREMVRIARDLIAGADLKIKLKKTSQKAPWSAASHKAAFETQPQVVAQRAL